MSVNPLTQLVLILYEYLYSKGNRLEKNYIDLLDQHYRNMFSSRPEKLINETDMLEIIRKKTEFDSFMQIQKEMYDLLKEYRPGGMYNPNSDSK